MFDSYGGGIHHTAVIGHPAEHRERMPGDTMHHPHVDRTARVEAYVTVDAGIYRRTTIGPAAWLMKHVHIGHDATIGQGCELAPGTVVGGSAELGRGVKVGINASILPFVKVGDGARIGAGAVVTKDVQPGAVMVRQPGSPAAEGSLRGPGRRYGSAGPAEGMRLIGLLSWFDEPVKDLVACLTALQGAGVDHVVAVDGRYGLYPAETDISSANEHAAIVLTCRNLNLGLSLHVPQGAWEGNEVEKRTYLFQAGWHVAEEGDWFWVQDADQVVMRCPEDLKDRLAATRHDTAEVEFLDTVALRANQPDWPPRFPVRSLFRAQSITLRHNHATYVTDDGRVLWGYENGQHIEPTLDLTKQVLVEHHPDRRPPERQQGKMVYYAARDNEGVERGDCHGCGVHARHMVPRRWRWTQLGPVAEWMEACDACAERQEKVNRRQLIQMGIDPDTMGVENRNGRLPAGMTD